MKFFSNLKIKTKATAFYIVIAKDIIFIMQCLNADKRTHGVLEA